MTANRRRGARLALLACAALAALAGCSRQRLLREFAPAQARTTAHAFIAHLRAKQFDWIARRANRHIQGPGLGTTLAYMASLIPPGKANSVKLVGAQTNIENGITERNLTYELDFRGQWVLINVATRLHGRSLTLTGMHVYRMRGSLESLNRFTLMSKSPLRYATLALMVFAFALTVYALILCARTPRATPQMAMGPLHPRRCRQVRGELDQRPLGRAGSRRAVVQRVGVLRALRSVGIRGFGSARRNGLSTAAPAPGQSFATQCTAGQ